MGWGRHVYNYWLYNSLLLVTPATRTRKYTPDSVQVLIIILCMYCAKCQITKERKEEKKRKKKNIYMHV